LEILNHAPQHEVDFFLVLASLSRGAVLTIYSLLLHLQLIDSFGERFDQGSGEISAIVRDTILKPLLEKDEFAPSMFSCKSSLLPRSFFVFFRPFLHLYVS